MLLKQGWQIQGLPYTERDVCGGYPKHKAKNEQPQNMWQGRIKVLRVAKDKEYKVCCFCGVFPAFDWLQWDKIKQQIFVGERINYYICTNEMFFMIN